MLKAEQNEILRETALSFLAARPAAAFEPRSARILMINQQMVDFKFTSDDLRVAFMFHVDLGNAKRIQGEFGVSEAFQATSKGILHVERRARDLGLEE